jgi:hypothetical protein
MRHHAGALPARKKPIRDSTRQTMREPMDKAECGPANSI